MLFGWTIVIGGTFLACIAWVFALRLVAGWTGVPLHPIWVFATATVAATATVSIICRLQGFRIATTHEPPLPWMLATAAATALLLTLIVRRVPGDSTASPVARAVLHGVCAVLIVGPPLVWFLAVPVPAWREEARNRVRGDYDEAKSSRDPAAARRILEANPWLAHEIEHALDGTVPADDE